MSSILIKGMEIPNYKPICIIIDPAGQARRYDLNNDKYADDELFEAVSVPPHGKLGDLDRLTKEVKDMEKEFPPDSISAERYRLFAEFIKTAPTIIPAELTVHHGTFAAASGKEALERIIPAEDSELSATIKCGGAVTCAVAHSEEVYNKYVDTAGNLRWTGTHSGEHIVRAEGDE